MHCENVKKLLGLALETKMSSFWIFDILEKPGISLYSRNRGARDANPSKYVYMIS
uniref:Transposase n=1 Tax=Heterorhabditis bacteriophora TaxID=37862 RepID=A0A1I7WJA3_HETBA